MEEDKVCRTEVKNLSIDHQIAFAASCMERMIPVYTAVCMSESVPGDPFLFHKYLDLVWGHLTGITLTTAQLNQMIVDAEDADIDPEEYDHFLIDGATAVAPAMTALLKACLYREDNWIEIVQELGIDTIYDYVRNVNAPLASEEVGILTEEFNEEMWRSPMMRAEWTKQMRDIASLKNQPRLDPAFIQIFRHDALFGGIQPFRRGLLPRSMIEQYEAFIYRRPR